MIGISHVNHGPMEDLEALFRDIRENTRVLGIDEQRIGVWSGSGNFPRALGLLVENDRPAIKEFRQSDSREIGVICRRTYRCSLRGWTRPATHERRDRPLYSHALAANLPLTVVNHPNGPHAFDIMDDSEPTREIVRQILAFLRHFTQG